MIKNYYDPIIRASTKRIFFDYIDCLNIPEIDYFAIGIQNIDLRKSISLMSNPEWQDVFNKNHYAFYDPLRKSTLFTKKNIIFFREIDHCDSFGKEIMRQRFLLGIKDGLVFVKRFKKYNYMITFGTRFLRFKAYDFLKKHHDKIFMVKNDLIKIIEKDAKAFIQKKLNYLSSDAI